LRPSRGGDQEPIAVGLEWPPMQGVLVNTHHLDMLHASPLYLIGPGDLAVPRQGAEWNEEPVAAPSVMRRAAYQAVSKPEVTGSWVDYPGRPSGQHLGDCPPLQHVFPGQSTKHSESGAQQWSLPQHLGLSGPQQWLGSGH